MSHGCQKTHSNNQTPSNIADRKLRQSTSRQSKQGLRDGSKDLANEL